MREASFTAVWPAQQRLSDRPARVIVVTLDPWRATPSRLDSIARDWNMGTDAHLLSGEPAVLERAPVFSFRTRGTRHALSPGGPRPTDVESAHRLA